MVASYYRSLGHVCVDLREVLNAPSLLPEELRPGGFPKLEEWVEQLRASALVGRPGAFAPLILDDHARLYLHRYWEYESKLAGAIRRRAAGQSRDVDWKRFSRGLERLFPNQADFDWQAFAAFVAIRNRLCIISGGPGTGKTRTVAMFLALLFEQPNAEKLRVALAAPTGKAAARLQEAMKSARESLPCSPEIKTRLPEQASTIHRLLQPIPNSPYFRHDAENLLPADVVVIDEASMVDLALMAKLVIAVPPSARLILLGDKDQLASVEAGAVLADICNGGIRRDYSSDLAAQFAMVTGREFPFNSENKTSPLSDCIVELRRNYRFADESEISHLSRAVNCGDAVRGAQLLQAPTSATGSEVSWRDLPSPNALKRVLKPIVLDSYADSPESNHPALALESFSRFRILCAVRHGPYGVENLNRLAEEILAEAGLVNPSARFYAGRPILITRNNYNLHLFNGDIGLLLHDSSRNELRAFFLGSDESVRSFLPLQLPPHETAFALTVHKSQGSEFERVLLLLPKDDSPVLTRELVYTGITRASNRVEVWSSESLFMTAVQRRIQRRSGLRDALWESS